MLSVLFYGEIRWTKLNKIMILPYFPYNPKAKLRLEVLFKKFHPRINLETLFSTKSYLLNTIKPFSDHENCFLTKSQKPLHSKIHVVDFTFMVRRINENSHTLSAYDFLRWFHDSDHWFYVSGAFYLKNNFWTEWDSNPRPLRTLFSIKTPNCNLPFSAMPHHENLTNNYQDE
jgi:hypothetical protein